MMWITTQDIYTYIYIYRERERESLLAQTNSFIQIKAKAQGYRKKNC